LTLQEAVAKVFEGDNINVVILPPNVIYKCCYSSSQDDMNFVILPRKSDLNDEFGW